MEQETKANKPNEQETKANKPKLPVNHFIYKKMKLQVVGVKDGKEILERVGKPIKELPMRDSDANELNSHKHNTKIEFVKK